MKKLKSGYSKLKDRMKILGAERPYVSKSLSSLEKAHSSTGITHVLGLLNVNIFFQIGYHVPEQSTILCRAPSVNTAYHIAEKMMATANVNGDGKQTTVEQIYCSAGFAAEIHGQLTFLSVLNIFLSASLGATLTPNVHAHVIQI